MVSMTSMSMAAPPGASSGLCAREGWRLVYSQFWYPVPGFHETLTHTAPGHAMDESEKQVLPSKRDMYVGLVVFVILAVTAWLLFVELGDTFHVNQWWVN